MSRAPLSVDSLALAMLLVIPLMILSIYLVRGKKLYLVHKWIQTLLGLGLAAILLVFEIKMRLIGWRDYAEDSPYYDSFVLPSLVLHLLVAVPTFFLWIFTIVGAWKNFQSSPKPSKYSMIHKRMARLSAGLMILTTLTGWLFYGLAFIASE